LSMCFAKRIDGSDVSPVPAHHHESDDRERAAL
jgi:hypothetical protein